MLSLKPHSDAFADFLGHIQGILSFSIGNDPGVFVVADVSFLLHRLKLQNGRRIDSNGMSQGLEGVVVMTSIPLRNPVSCRSKRGFRRLKNGVVSNAQFPSRAMCSRSAFIKIALDKGKQFVDLLSTRLVLNDEAMNQPISQTHRRHL